MKNKQEQKEYNKRHRRTMEGVLSMLYSRQRSASKERGHPMPNYSLKELKEEFRYKPKFYTLYLNWIWSDYSTWEKPSLDRIDDDKPYTLSNLQWMTWYENKRKRELENRKAVYKIDLKIGSVKLYTSLQETKLDGFNVTNVSRCAKGLRHNYKGFVWKFKS